MRWSSLAQGMRANTLDLGAERSRLVLYVAIRKIMGAVRDNADSGTSLAVLTADVGRLDDRVGRLDDRIGTLETRIGGLGARSGKLEFRIDELAFNVRETGTRLGALTERMARIEMAIDFLCTDIKNINDNVLAIRTTDFHLMFGALMAVTLGLSGMMATDFGRL